PRSPVVRTSRDRGPRPVPGPGAESPEGGPPAPTGPPRHLGRPLSAGGLHPLPLGGPLPYRGAGSLDHHPLPPDPAPCRGLGRPRPPLRGDRSDDDPDRRPGARGAPGAGGAGPTGPAPGRLPARRGGDRDPGPLQPLAAGA